MLIVYLSVILKRKYSCPDFFFFFFCCCCIWDHSRFVSKCIKYVHKSVDMLLCIVRCRSRKSIQTFLIRFLVSKLFSVQLPFIILLDMESMLACRYFCPVHLEYNKGFSHMLYKEMFQKLTDPCFV